MRLTEGESPRWVKLSGSTTAGEVEPTRRSQGDLQMTDRQPLRDLEGDAPFELRHLGPSPDQQAKMLAALGHDSLEDLVAAAVPAGIRAPESLGLPPARSEAEALQDLRELAGQNRVVPSMIGLGYHGTHTPGVILRNVVESPAWYTA